MDALFFCPHVADDACGCRLPAPGLLAQIAERYGAEPRHLFVMASDPALLHADLDALVAHLLSAPAPAPLP